MQSCVVYWLHLQHHTDPSTEGYVGKSTCAKVRWRAHRKSEKFPPEYTETVLFAGTEAECLRRERELRPGHSIGWNVMPGGGQPPSQKGKKQRPRVFTEEHIRNLSTAHIGQPAWNKGLPTQSGALNRAKSSSARAKISAAKLVQPSCKRIEVDGKIYQSIGAASRALSIPKTTLRRRLNGDATCKSLAL